MSVHSDEALLAIGLGQVQEMESGELWVPGELDGYSLWTIQDGYYHVRKVYRNGGRSKVLKCGMFDDCLDWLRIYLNLRGQQARQNMIVSGVCNCRHHQGERLT